MDGDRPMVDGRDLLESELQELIHDVFIYGKYSPIGHASLDGYSERLHKLLVSHLDGETGDVVAQDETSEAREVGDRVRPESYLKDTHFETMFIDEITDEFAREMGLRFAYEGKKVAMGHSELTKMPDGSICARIKYYPQNPR